MILTVMVDIVLLDAPHCFPDVALNKETPREVGLLRFPDGTFKSSSSSAKTVIPNVVTFAPVRATTLNLAILDHRDRSSRYQTQNRWLRDGTPGRERKESARWPLTEQRFPLSRVKTNKVPLNRNHTEAVEGRIS